MLPSNCKWLMVSVLVFGMVVEVNTAYKRAIGLPVEAMGGVPIQRIPRQFHNTLTEIPFIDAYDGMTLTSGTIVAFSEEEFTCVN